MNKQLKPVGLSSKESRPAGRRAEDNGTELLLCPGCHNRIGTVGTNLPNFPGPATERAIRLIDYFVYVQKRGRWVWPKKERMFAETSEGRQEQERLKNLAITKRGEGDERGARFIEEGARLQQKHPRGDFERVFLRANADEKHQAPQAVECQCGALVWVSLRGLV